MDSDEKVRRVTMRAASEALDVMLDWERAALALGHNRCFTMLFGGFMFEASPL